MSIKHKLTKKWVSGKSLQNVIEDCQRNNKSGLKTIVNNINYDNKNHYSVKKTLDNYMKLIANIKLLELNTDLIIKTSEIGLDIGKGHCVKNLLDILHYADKSMIWLDTRYVEHVNDTMDIYMDLRKHYSNVGITLRANTRSSRKNMLKILNKNGRIRLVEGKGAGNYAFKKDVENNFSRLLRILFSKGNNFAINTYNPTLIEETKILNARYSKDFELHFDMGTREKLRNRLSERFNVSVQIPFGKNPVTHTIKSIGKHALIDVIKKPSK